MTQFTEKMKSRVILLVSLMEVTDDALKHPLLLPGELPKGNLTGGLSREHHGDTELVTEHLGERRDAVNLLRVEPGHLELHPMDTLFIHDAVSTPLGHRSITPPEPVIGHLETDGALPHGPAGVPGVILHWVDELVDGAVPLNAERHSQGAMD